MIRFTITITLIFLLSFTSKADNKYSHEYEQFNKFMGKEKAKILKKALISFDNFLKVNFNDYKNDEDRVIAFLENLKHNILKPNSKWIYNMKSDLKLIQEFEKTQLRKDIWIYGYEENDQDTFLLRRYNHIQDSIRNANKKDAIYLPPLEELDDLYDEIRAITRKQDSAYIQNQIEDSIRLSNKKTSSNMSYYVLGIYLYNKTDTIMQLSIKDKIIVGSIATDIIIDSLLNKNNNYNFSNPFTKTFIIMEIYYHVLFQNLERNNITLNF